MPGRNLNSEERELLNFWKEVPVDFPQPLLKSVAVDGPPGLRGIERLHVPFEYPITAVCGRNGVGKSTVLSLATLSASRPKNWEVGRWATAPQRRQPKMTSYDWRDFFYRRDEDQGGDGLKVRFTFSFGGNDIEVERRRERGRWYTVPDPGRSKRSRFPQRPIEFVSVARVLPLAEVQYVRRRFVGERVTRVDRLDDQMIGIMCDVFRQQYGEVELLERQGATLAVCRGERSYDGFDMGSGENAVIAVLYRLQRLPVGGLLVVEEIEHGLHPEALRRLVNSLTSVVRGKKVQLIFTTHSDHVIDRLPREGRVLMERLGSEHRVVAGPTTRFAMSNISGINNPECTVYVEDNFAAALVKACLAQEVRGRVEVIAIGGGAQVASQCAAHIRGGMQGPAFCVFDGDCRERDIRRWFRSEQIDEDEVRYERLPSEGVAPESWVVGELRKEPYLGQLANAIGCEVVRAEEEIVRLATVGDHHRIPRELAERVALSEEVAVSYLVSAIGRKHPSLEIVRVAVAKMLGSK